MGGGGGYTPSLLPALQMNEYKKRKKKGGVDRIYSQNVIIQTVQYTTENHSLHLKSQCTDSNSEMTQRLELPGKDFKSGIIKMLQETGQG